MFIPCLEDDSCLNLIGSCVVVFCKVMYYVLES